MSKTFTWGKDKTKLAIWNKQVFHVDRHGDKWWSLNGKRHRVDGPAVEYANGYKVWWLNGKLHRENGPAIEFVDGDKSWWLNGLWFTESDYWHIMKEKNE